MLKFICILTIFLIMPFYTFGQKQRLLITTDIGGDPDDQQSLIRLMVYSNEFDIEGLISSAAGTPGELGKAMVRPDLIREIIHAYESVYPNLIKHDKNFPSPGDLLKVVKKGNPYRGWEFVGEGNDTEGSDWIIQTVDKDDKRPLNISVFGGQTDLAQALWNVKNSRTPEEYQKFISKIRIYDINDQDKIFNLLIADHPDLWYILAKAPEGHDKREGAYRGIYLGGNEDLTSMEWMRSNVLENHGPLGELYPRKTWTAPNPHGVMKEGDTPSWFYFLNNGLNVPEHPEFGGWGGRFQKNDKGYFSDAIDSFGNEAIARAGVYRWREDFQNDFAARMDWCVGEYNECNHPPVVVINGIEGRENLTLDFRVGDNVTLDAAGSSDPDKNELSYEWMVYKEAGNFSETIEIKFSGTMATFLMPQLEPDSSIHIILKVSDKGMPGLSAYRRIILRNC